MKRQKGWSLALALLMTGCAEGPPLASSGESSAIPAWADVHRAWRSDASGHVDVWVSITGTHKGFYSYEANWSAAPFLYEIEVAGPFTNKGTVKISDTGLAEGGKTTAITTGPQEGAPSLANLFALTNDLLNPFGLLAGEPSSKQRTATGYAYAWTFPEGSSRRDFTCEIDSATKRPIKLTISQPEWSAPTEVTYSFGPSSGRGKPVSATGEGVPWATAIASSPTLASLRSAVAQSVNRATAGPTDPMTGRPDPWKVGYDVRAVKTWGALKGKVGRLRLPATWPPPTSVEERSYKNPATGTPIYEARAYLANSKRSWRLTIQESAMAYLAYELYLKEGEAITDSKGRQFYYFGDPLGTGDPHSIFWIEGKTLLFSIESGKADRAAMLKLAAELRRP